MMDNPDAYIVSESIIANIMRKTDFNTGLNQLIDASRHGREGDDVDTLWKKLVLDYFSSEILRYSTEDNAKDISDLHASLSNAFLSVIKKPRVTSKELKALTKNLQSTVLKPEIKYQLVELHIPINRGYCIALGRIPLLGEQSLIVSGKRFDLMPVLEQSLSEPRMLPSIGRAYVEQLERLYKETPFDRICFISKSVGPIGAMPLLTFLVNEMNKPTFIFRQNYWGKQTDMAGSIPKPAEKVVFVYDLCVTGGAIRRAARTLRDQYEVDVVGAVVLMSYDNCIDTVDYSGHELSDTPEEQSTSTKKRKTNGKYDTLALRPIALYQDFTLNVQELRNIEATDHIPVLHSSKESERRQVPLAGGSLGRLFAFLKGELTMTWLTASDDGHKSEQHLAQHQVLPMWFSVVTILAGIAGFGGFFALMFWPDFATALIAFFGLLVHLWTIEREKVFTKGALQDRWKAKNGSVKEPVH